MTTYLAVLFLMTFTGCCVLLVQFLFDDTFKGDGHDH